MSLEDHRALYRADLLISKMVAQQPPTSRDANTGVLHQEEAAVIGMTISGRLLRYLSHPEGYGEAFPWSSALWVLKDHCHKNHLEHRRTDRRYWRGALCHQIVWLTVIGGEKDIGPMSPKQAAQVLRLESPEPVLSQALRFIEEAIDHQRDRAQKRAREDEGIALVCACGHSWSRHGGYVVGWRCLEDACTCRRYAAQAVVQQEHPPSETHRTECPRCRRAA